MGRHQIRIDRQKRRIYLTLVGFFTDEEMTKAANEFIADVEKMPRGFSMVNDISELKPLSQFGTQEIKRASEACVRQGLSITVRVVGGSPTATMQFNRNAQNVGYAAGSAGTVAEAEQLIEKHLAEQAK